MKSKQLRNIFLAGALMTLCGVLTSYADDEQQQQQQEWATLSSTELSLKLDEKKTLTVTFGEDCKETSVEWTSQGNAEIIKFEASDDKKSVGITGLKEGNTYVVCKAKAIKVQDNDTTNFSKAFLCTINVSKPDLVKINLSATRDVKQGDTLLLVPTFDPVKASTKNLTWTSDKPEIAVVYSTGAVMGLKEGTAQITVTAKGTDKSATCTVTVKAPDPTYISLPDTITTLNPEGTKTLTPKVYPDNASTEGITYTWTSSNSEVVSVDTNGGKLTAIKAGVATITAKTTVNGKELSATCVVSVVVKPQTIPELESISLPETAELCIDSTLTLTPSYLPAEASKPSSYTWTSDNPAVATVTSWSGEVKGISAGTATITAKTIVKGKEYTASCVVTVKADTDISAKENALYVVAQAIKVDDNNEFILPVCLKNAANVVGVSFTLTLPQGMTLKADADGDFDKTGCVLNEERAASSGYNVLGAFGKDSCSCSIAIMPNATSSIVTGTDGTLITFTVKVADDVKGGEYTVLLSENSLTVKDGEDNLSTLPLANTRSTLTIPSNTLSGDVNNDGKLDITDANKIIFASLGEPEDGFDWDAADVNKDGRVDLTDAIIVLYESLKPAPTSPRRKAANASTYNDEIVIDDVVIEKGSFVELPVKFLNPEGDKIVGMQMNLILPEGVSTLKNNEVPVAVLDGTSCPKMSIYPTSSDGFGILATTLNASVKGTEGTLFTTTLCADNDLEAGSVLEAKATNVKFSVKDASGSHAVPVADFTFSITIGNNPDAIVDIAGIQENGEARFSLSGQRVSNGFKGIVVMKGKKMFVK